MSGGETAEQVDQLAAALLAVAGVWDFMPFDDQARLAFGLLPNNPLAHLEVEQIAKDYLLGLLQRRGSTMDLRHWFDEHDVPGQDAESWRREYMRRSEVSFAEAETSALKAAVTELVG